ncbi:MAG: OmpA family protein [Wenzhouxiangellaceae bacterium]|nr:OmpA family protein [Wenzhouxiangellaceae bacterium]
MRISTAMQIGRTGRTTALLSSLLFLAACATTPTSPPGAAEARSKLSALQADSNLAERAPLELQEAEAAVRIAERPVPALESSLGEHRVYMAERKIDIARARATGRYAMDQRAILIEEREQARLNARSREAQLARADANRARSDANLARSDASRAQNAASSARYAEIQAMADADASRRAANSARQSEAQASAGADAARRDAETARLSEAQATANADAARRDADSARRSEARASAQAADLRRQIDALEAEITDRGLVLTLGDLLFATDRAILEPGADRHLDRLVVFLERYPQRRVEIEGHTDNVGARDYNLGLSQRRAESVLSSLNQRGIDSSRLSALGLGQERPIASNLTAAGRQQNRRVEIIIENPPAVAGN